MQDTQVRLLGQEDPLEKKMAIHSSILAWRIPMDRGAWQTTVHGVSKSWTRLSEVILETVIEDRGGKKEKETNRGGLKKQSLLWAAGSQSCWKPLGQGCLRSVHPRARKLEYLSMKTAPRVLTYQHFHPAWCVG